MSATDGPTYHVKRVRAGWAVDADGRRRLFGSSFVALRTAIRDAGPAEATVIFEEAEGRSRLAWRPGVMLRLEMHMEDADAGEPDVEEPPRRSAGRG